MPSMTKVHAILSVWTWMLVSHVQALYGLDLGKIPNGSLGTCLDMEWVQEMEQRYNIEHEQRDAKRRLLYPFFQPAIQIPRFHVHDDRTEANTSELYSSSCMSSNTSNSSRFYGHKGTSTFPGYANGSLILELHDSTTHALSSMVFAILASEIYGYPIAFYLTSDSMNITQRMSHVREGKCTPTHVNLEVWRAGIEHFLDVYSNESFNAGSIGYVGRSGVYTTLDFIQNGLNTSMYPNRFYADFWKDYQSNEDLINALKVSSLWNNQAHFPPKRTGCQDRTLGCLNHCSKSFACTQRENATPKKECLVVIMMDTFLDPGYLEAVFSNLNIPAYFCFLTHPGVDEYVVEAQAKGDPVLFFHFEPDAFHIQHANKFERIYLPPPHHAQVESHTGTFGENGYGQPTSNPVNVDFPPLTLVKYAADVLIDTAEGPIGNFVGKFSITEADMEQLLEGYVKNPFAKDKDDPSRHLHSACAWVRTNYKTWKHWMDRLPMCTLEDDMRLHVIGCHEEDNLQEASIKSIGLKWIYPHPDNGSRPYRCDGGPVIELPLGTFAQSSRSCQWIRRDPYKWLLILTDGMKPTCDVFFHGHHIAPTCDTRGKRLVHFFWNIPDPKDPTQSLECAEGDPLPKDFYLDCEYMPLESPSYHSIMGLAITLMIVYALAMIWIYKNRELPVIKRSQYELLEVLLVGAIIMSGVVIVQAGKPTAWNCALRPALLSTAFTLIFGSILVKSYRVYRIFMGKMMKKIKITNRTMIKLLGFCILVDAIVLSIWFIVDIPFPTSIKSLDQTSVHLSHNTLVCTSPTTGFLFTALILFWKGLLLALGLYFSFKIRNVSSDFQETFWIFASSMVVCMGGMILLPLVYLVELAPYIVYLFVSCLLLFCTFMVVVLMLFPKYYKRKSVMDASSSKSTIGPSTGSTITSSASVTNPMRKSLTGVVPSKASEEGTTSSVATIQTAPIARHSQKKITEQSEDMLSSSQMPSSSGGYY